jgi:GNAT superfamily N-acetyltransferase
MPITKAIPADVPELNTLVNSAYRGETSQLGWTSEAHLLDGIRIDEGTLTSYFNDDKIIILKNTDESGHITGCVYLEVRTPKLYLGMFSVSPLLQGKGVGKDLLAAAESYAKQLNCDKLIITVISSRSELIDWYQRRGFKATGEIEPFHEGTKFGIPKQYIELVVMEKEI